MAELRIPRPPQTCQRCGADFFIRPSKLKDGRGTYCSRACRYALSLEERFWANIDKTPGLGPHGECWEWRGVLASGGYGRLHTGPGTKYIRAHRFAWTLEHGPIPKGMDVLHKCDNPPCVRCLFLGTQLDTSLPAAHGSIYRCSRFATNGILFLRGPWLALGPVPVRYLLLMLAGS